MRTPDMTISANQTRECHKHEAVFCRDAGTLRESVVTFLARGLSRGDAVVVIGTCDHWRLFEAGLRGAGFDVVDLLRRGAILVLDAAEQLSLLLKDARPDRRLFQDVVGACIREAGSRAPSGRVCAYGEMVDLLWHEGRFDAAASLEDLWCELARARSFDLLCTYTLDLFEALDRGAPVELAASRHTASSFGLDRARLESSLERALRETLGVDRAANLSRFLRAVEPRSGFPRGPENSLFWLRDNGPHGLGVIERTRHYYQSAAESGCPEKWVPGTTGRATVLLVEDDPNDVALFEHEWHRYADGLDLRHAKDGEQAWAWLAGEGKYADRATFPVPAHVVLDLRLPRKSGFELLEDMKRLARRPPVTIHSSSSEPSDVARAYSLGAAAYVVKRYDMSELVRGLATLCTMGRSLAH